MLPIEKRNDSSINRFVLMLCLLLVFGCGQKEKESHSPSSNLLSLSLTLELPPDAEKRFKETVTGSQLSARFKTGPVNTLSKTKASTWIGRIKENDVSYQALFTIDNTVARSAAVNIGKGTDDMMETKGMHFAIYHPENSQLTYRILLRSGDSETTAFEKKMTAKSFENFYISFETLLKEDSAGKEISIVFKTEGKGPGAWVTPRLHQVKKKPRVFIVMVLDTLRYDHTTVYGYHRDTTPNLAKLAKDGVNYQRAYTSTSWTLPSHVSLFSGMDISRHGVMGPGDSISTHYPLLAEIFQQQGFLTAAFTGGGFVEDSYGFHRGFQYYSNVPGNVFSMNSAERVLNHFKNYIKDRWGQDLFIFLHTYQIHAPYKAPRQYIDRIDKRVEGNLLGVGNYLKQKHEFFKPLPETDRQRLIDLYDASILYTDEALIGGIVSLLKEKGLYDESTIAVLSDHGEEFYDHGSWEHGHTVYNEVVKIPMVVKFPFSSAGPSLRGKTETALAAIWDIPGLMLKHSGFGDHSQIFPLEIGQEGRRLPVLFPVSPTVKQFPTKLSFVDNDHHFIFNNIDKEKITFFNPRPKRMPVFELFETADVKERNNLYKKRFQLVQQYRKLVREIEATLKRLKRKGRTIDKDLKDKLKSLGYLGE